MSKVVAVIDIGSNSARMAIFRRTSRFGFSLIFETKSKVRISEGCYENNGILQEIPMLRALGALKDFSKIASLYKARKVFCVATSAVRDALNRDEFLRRAKKEANIKIKVIDGQKEAFFGAVACSNLLHKKNGITIDIGGGSTECAIIENGHLKDLISLNLGTIRLKELFFDAKPDIKAAINYINRECEKLPSHFKNEAVFGIGGTIRALAKLIMKKENYPIEIIHGFEFSALDYLDFFKKIYTSDIKKLKNFDIPQDREDNIRGGALIFAMLLDKFCAREVITSGVGVREGVFLADLLRNQKFIFPRNFNPSLKSLTDRFDIDQNRQIALLQNATMLFSALKSRHKIDESFLFHLQSAAKLAKIGEYLSSYMSHEHSAYFVLHELKYGYSHTDKAIIYLLVKYSSKKIPQDDEIVHLSALMPDILVLQWLSFILSLAEALSIEGVASFCFENDTLKIASHMNLTKEKILSLHQPEALNIEFSEGAR